jgi:hypothetical protein
MAELGDEQAGQAVQVALALGVVEIGALTLDHDGYVGVGVRPVPGEMHPQVILGSALQPSVFVHGAIVGENYAGIKRISRSIGHILLISSVVVRDPLLISS